MIDVVSRGRLLVIDDDVGMQALLLDVLDSLGYVVTCFSDALDALKLITSSDEKINVVICDLNMPKVSGLDFLDSLRKLNRRIPVILITAFSTAKTVREARARGAFGCLSKPFQLSEIHELIEEAMVSEQYDL